MRNPLSYVCFLVVRGSCYSGYKKCEHYCIEVAIGKGQCKCKERFKLSSDGKSCNGTCTLPRTGY